MPSSTSYRCGGVAPLPSPSPAGRGDLPMIPSPARVGGRGWGHTQPGHTQPYLHERPFGRLAALVALLGILSATGAPANGAEPLGRLFFTPEQRAQLDRQRENKVREVQVVQGATLSVDGVVRGPSGRSTVWVNGTPQYDDAGKSGISAIVQPGDSGRVTVLAGDEKPASLRVGEKIDRATHERHNMLGAGSVRVNSH